MTIETGEPKPGWLAQIRRHPIRVISRIFVAAFVGLHISAVCWWLIPAKGYPKDHRTVEPAAWVGALEEAVISWKRRNLGTFWAKALEKHIFVTASWQKWWLFAPNPPEAHDWITVKAVIGWRDPDSTVPPEERKKGVWGNEKMPIYDPVPLYGSYPGSLSDEGTLPSRMKGSAGPYFHDPKLVENLASGDWDRPLASFAEYWHQVYRSRWGKSPLGIHVILARGTIPPAFTGREPAGVSPTSRVLWYIHY